MFEYRHTCVDLDTGWMYTGLASSSYHAMMHSGPVPTLLDISGRLFRSMVSRVSIYSGTWFEAPFRRYYLYYPPRVILSTRYIYSSLGDISTPLDRFAIVLRSAIRLRYLSVGSDTTLFIYIIYFRFQL